MKFYTLKLKSMGVMMKLKFEKVTLKTRIIIFSFSLVLLAVILVGAVLTQRVARVLEDEIGIRALAIARTLCQMDDMKNNIENINGWQIIQPVAEKTRLATGVEYIVAVNLKGIRQSHPIAERVGTQYTGEDLESALKGEEVITRTLGPQGSSIRALVPIKVEEGTRIAGAVVVGIATPGQAALLKAVQVELYSSMLALIILGLIGSMALANRVKKALFNMEPVEIATLLEERTAILQAMGEGIIAIDKNNKITVANKAAIKILGLREDALGKNIKDILPISHLPRIVETGKSEYNQERVINSTIIITNRVPIWVNGAIAGAVATFRDRTEVHRLAEELTGVKSFIEALRVQNHEHANRLHTIAGLIQLQKYNEVNEYIFNITEEQQLLAGILGKNIKDYSISGLLMGKYSRAKELGIEMIIESTSSLDKLPQGLASSTMVLIIGNLLENAMDSLKGWGGKKQIFFSIKECNDNLTIKVKDTGPGIPGDNKEKIFDWGFSTRGEISRGIGLYLVKGHVLNAGGSIELDNQKGENTFLVSFPIKNAGSVQP